MPFWSRGDGASTAVIRPSVVMPLSDDDDDDFDTPQAQESHAGGSPTVALVEALHSSWGNWWNRDCGREGASAMQAFGIRTVPGIPDSPTSKGPSSVMQAPRAPASKAADDHQASEKTPAKRPQALETPAADAADAAQRPAGPTLLRYRGLAKRPQRDAAPEPPPFAAGAVGASRAGAVPAEAAKHPDDDGAELCPLPAYPHGSIVEYYSVAERRWVLGTVAVVASDVADVAATLAYEVAAGRPGQLHRDVPLTRLREPLKEGEAVEVRAARCGSEDPAESSDVWTPAVIQASPKLPRARRAGGAAPAHSYRASAMRSLQAVLDGGEAAEGSMSGPIAPERIRRRFEAGVAVEAYRGSALGWVPGVVADAAAPDAAGGDGGSRAATGSGEGKAVLVCLAATRCCKSAEAGDAEAVPGGTAAVPAHLLRPRRR